jgi:hypothetical protein
VLAGIYHGRSATEPPIDPPPFSLVAKNAFGASAILGTALLAKARNCNAVGVVGWGDGGSHQSPLVCSID